MIETTKESWLAGLQNGDIGLLHSHNFFATLQNLRRKKLKEGDLFASHGFYIYHPPSIMESNGMFVSQGKIFKDIGDSTQVWIFHYSKITDEQIDDMNIFWEAANDSGGHYSIGGIVQFGLQFLGFRKKLTDASGIFCSEGTGLALVRAKVPYITELKPYEIDPSYQLNWFLSDKAKKLGWTLALYYDGNGKYFKEA